MSRRDELVDSLTSSMTQLSARMDLGSAAASARSIPVLGRVVNLVERVVDIPAPSSSSAPSAPAAAAASTSAYMPYQGHRERSVSVNRAPSLQEAGDELPAYSRTRVARRTIPTSIHSYKTQRMKIDIEAAGKGEHVIILGAEEGERVDIKGVLHLILPQPELITHIRIRVKGITRTLVLKERRHPVGDEVTFWEESIDLYSETTPTVLPNNESADPTKTKGTFSFPFTLHLPSKVQAPGIGAAIFSLPPSFVLNGGAENRGMNEWASCRYYIKVTLGRKGILKANERLVVPLVFLPRSKEPRVSLARMTAMLSGSNTIPGPLDDPVGWSGRKLTQPVKRGVFSAKKAWYTVVVLLPSPASFSRLTHIPFHIKVASSDPAITTTFPEASMSAFLVQRAEVVAQGLAGLHDSIVATSVDLADDGASEGEMLPLSSMSSPESPTWSKTFKGSIKLTSNVGSSFSAPNLAISFLVVFRASCPGAGNNAEIAVPVKIVSSFRSQTAHLPAPLPTASDDLDIVLPPSYFEVMETT